MRKIFLCRAVSALRGHTGAAFMLLDRGERNAAALRRQRRAVLTAALAHTDAATQGLRQPR